MTMGVATQPRDVADGATCLGCGYPLRGLSDPRCPECGRAFDPTDPYSVDSLAYAQRRLRRALHWAPLAVWIATLGTMLVVEAYAYNRYEFYDWLPFPLATCLIVAILTAWIARGLARRALIGRRPDPSRLSERLARIGMWLTCGFIFLAFNGNGFQVWTCDHGTGWSLGPVGLAHSTVGGPCRNHIDYRKVWRVAGAWYVWVSP